MAGDRRNLGFPFGLFMVAATVAAVLPSREHQLYRFDCAADGGLMTKIVDSFGADTGDWRADPATMSDCWPGTGLLAGNVFPEAGAPALRVARTVDRSRSLVTSLGREPADASGLSEGFSPALPQPETAGEQASNLAPPPAAGGRQLAFASPRPFPGGLSTPPLGLHAPGAGAPSSPPATGGTPTTPSTDDDPPTPEPTGNTPPPPIGDPVLPAVPEPATWLLLLLGFFGIGWLMRSRSPARVVAVRLGIRS